MPVYVIEAGEMYEGYGFSTVHRTYAAALRAVGQYMRDEGVPFRRTWSGQPPAGLGRLDEWATSPDAACGDVVVITITAVELA